MTAARLGVISFAHGHVNRYIAALAGLPDAQVVAAWDDDRARGSARCVAFEPHLDALPQRDDLDAVFITSPANQA